MSQNANSEDSDESTAADGHLTLVEIMDCFHQVTSDL
jgi:hypothetical protein